MSMTIKEDTDLVYNRNYKVCHYVNEKSSTNTFTNKLVNADGTYFWFSSIENGLAVVRQDMIVYMGCVDEPKRAENEDIKINRLILFLCSYDRNNALEELKNTVQNFKKETFKEPKLITGNIETLKYLFPKFIQKHTYKNMYNGIELSIDSNLPFCVVEIK